MVASLQMLSLSLVLGFTCNLVRSQEETAEPIKLNDDNFEHLTQAATGATTGDWLVLFSRKDCPVCAKPRGIFKELAARLSKRMNIALIDPAHDTGLKRRFKIEKLPNIIFFRGGFQFSYMGEIDVDKLENFVLSGYRDVRKQAVMKPQSTLFFAFLVIIVTALFNGCLFPISHAEDGPWNWSKTSMWLEDTIQEIMVSIKERRLPSNKTMGLAVGSLAICLAILLLCCSGKGPEPISKTKKEQ